MTEEEWDQSIDPAEMVTTHLRHRPNSRKLRLFTCACCRRIWSLLAEPIWRDGVSLAEKLADGNASMLQLAPAIELIEHAEKAIEGDHPQWVATRLRSGAVKSTLHQSTSYDISASLEEQRADTAGTTDWIVAIDGAECAARIKASSLYNPDNESPGAIEKWQNAKGIEAGEQASLLRDIFGNPFRPVSFDPRWRTSDVVGLAQAIYDDKAFERMPILADALMDARCEDEQIIGHCRGDGPHVRGCWVVDLILDKK